MILPLVMAIQTIAGSEPSNVHYEVGGFIGVPYDLQLDLDSGDATVKTRRRIESGWVDWKRRYRFAASDLANVRHQAKTIAAHGVSEPRCRGARRFSVPPPMDGYVILRVVFEGKSTTAGPNSSCMSAEADRFVDRIKLILDHTPPLLN